MHVPRPGRYAATAFADRGRFARIDDSLRGAN